MRRVREPEEPERYWRRFYESDDDVAALQSLRGHGESGAETELRVLVVVGCKCDAKERATAQASLATRRLRIN